MAWDVSSLSSRQNSARLGFSLGFGFRGILADGGFTKRGL